ncbi:MAG: hypothetical protein HUJ63_10315 [Enterococcus sp.]|nr:hypothetical protein [Enterococcus sp.]
MEYANGHREEIAAREHVYSMSYETPPIGCASFSDTFETGSTDVFHVPIKPDSDIKSISVRISGNDSSAGAPWCPDWLRINGMTISFNDPKVKHYGGSKEDGHWWANAVGNKADFDYSLFNSSEFLKNHSFRDVKIKTPSAHKDDGYHHVYSDISIELHYKNGIEGDRKYLATEYLTGACEDTAEPFYDEQFYDGRDGHIYSGSIPCRLDCELESISVQVTYYREECLQKFNTITWRPEYLEFGDKKFKFDDAYHIGGLWKGFKTDSKTEPHWLMNEKDGSSATFYLNKENRGNLPIEIGTANIDGAGTDSDIKFVVAYSDNSTACISADKCSDGRHDEPFETGYVDAFHLPAKVDTSVKSITVEVEKRDGKLNAEWCPDFLKFGEKTIKFDDAYHNSGFWCENKKTGTHWWMLKKGDSATFYLNKWNRGNIPIEIGTDSISGAGTNADIKFVVTYSDDSTASISANDCSDGRYDDKFEAGHVDAFHLPAKVDTSVKSITVEVEDYGSQTWNDWCPDFLKFDGQKMWFQTATHNGGVCEGGYWWMRKTGDSATFYF